MDMDELDQLAADFKKNRQPPMTPERAAQMTHTHTRNPKLDAHRKRLAAYLDIAGDFGLMMLPGQGFKDVYENFRPTAKELVYGPNRLRAAGDMAAMGLGALEDAAFVAAPMIAGPFRGYRAAKTANRMMDAYRGSKSAKNAQTAMSAFKDLGYGGPAMLAAGTGLTAALDSRERDAAQVDIDRALAYLRSMRSGQ